MQQPTCHIIALRQDLNLKHVDQEFLKQAEVAGKIPVLIDSGFRGGADVFKALALGATAVGIGRPILAQLRGSGSTRPSTL